MVYEKWIQIIDTKRSLNVRELSDKTGIPQTTLYNWFSKRVSAPFDGIERVLNALGYRIEIVPIDKDGREEFK